MDYFRPDLFLLIFCMSTFHLCTALYEDQVGKFDWKLSYIGRVKLADVDTKRVVAVTEQNVVASLHIKSGQILWRHVLENPNEQSTAFLFVDKEVVTVSGAKNSWLVRGWDLNSGTLLWDWTLFSEQSVEPKWFVSDEKLHQININIGSHVEIAQYSLQTGHSQGSITVPTPWITEISACVLSAPYLVCTSTNSSSGQLYYLDLLTKEVQSIPISTLIGVSSDVIELFEFRFSKPAFSLSRTNFAKIIIIEDGTLRVLKQDIFSSSRTVLCGDVLLQLEINPDNPEKLIRIKSTDVNSKEEVGVVDIQYPLGLGAPYIVGIGCKEPGMCDLLLSSSDDAVTLVRLPAGKVLWTREEALSRVVSVEFLELPVSELDASIENEFKSISGDIFNMLYLRLVSQIRQLSTFLPGTQLLSANSGLVRDEFGIHKLTVVATAPGKLFAIDTLSGSIVWSYRLPNVMAFSALNGENMLLFVQRTARYAPLPAQCMLIAKDANTGNGVLFRFDPITGKSTYGIERLSYRVKQAMLLSDEEENHIKGVIILSEDKQIYVYPDSAKSTIFNGRDTNYIFTADGGILNGYSFSHSTRNNIKPNQMWTVRLGSSQLVAISIRPSTERVHSQGRVLPDRSVYYKYINPNLIAVATLTDDPIHKHVISVYLIDGITGLVVYSVSHKRAKGPVNLIHSENWLVYSYFNERYRRYEMTAVELYEGEEQSNSTIFSSHAVSWLPYAESQSYILPTTPLIMCSTLTERGITSKFIIIALANGIVTQIPWALIEPRLSDFACGPEESCFPYLPEIYLPPEASLNYNQSLKRVSGIRVAPARLESTSHVLVYGLDVFYTRVAPSKTFDMLKEDFDHKLIILVLSGLVIASYVTKKLASKKALRQAWK